MEIKNTKKFRQWFKIEEREINDNNRVTNFIGDRINKKGVVAI